MCVGNEGKAGAVGVCLGVRVAVRAEQPLRRASVGPGGDAGLCDSGSEAEFSWEGAIGVR